VGGQVLKDGSVIFSPLWKGRRWRCVAVVPFGPSERSLDERVTYLKVLAVAENNHAAGLPVLGQLIMCGYLVAFLKAVAKLRRVVGIWN
jgi:hypothetical protein